MSNKKKSEFGRGIVVCLAKFSDHIDNESARNIQILIGFKNSPDQLEHYKAIAKLYPYGGSARLANIIETHLEIYKDIDDAISQAIVLWANGASDHLYEIDRNWAPAPLKALAEFTIKIGHGFTGKKYTPKDWMKVQTLWREACIACDKKLGVETDWGQW